MGPRPGVRISWSRLAVLMSTGKCVEVFECDGLLGVEFEG